MPTPAAKTFTFSGLRAANERVVLLLGVCAFLVAMSLSIVTRILLEQRRIAAPGLSQAATGSARALAIGDVMVPVTLSIKFAGGQAVIRGMLPDEAAHRTVLARAREVFGKTNVDDYLAVQSGIVVTPWFDSVLKWFPPRINELKAGEISVSGMNVLLFGEVTSEEARLSAAKSISKLLGPEGQLQNEIRVDYAAELAPLNSPETNKKDARGATTDRVRNQIF